MAVVAVAAKHRAGAAVADATFANVVAVAVIEFVAAGDLLEDMKLSLR